MAIAVKGLGIEEPKVVSDKVVEDADWVRITQAQFQPVRVSDRLWIVPTWHEPPAGDTAINIRLLIFAYSGLTPMLSPVKVFLTTDAVQGFWQSLPKSSVPVRYWVPILIPRL